jgi:hypothetical protein
MNRKENPKKIAAGSKIGSRSPARQRRRFQRLARALAQTEWILQGTICPRRLPASRRGLGGRRQKHGPYYQWTFKAAGKTVTVNLSAAQQRSYQQAIDRNRKLKAMLAEMRALTRQYLEATTPGVIKRKSPS